jgi:hypothetical protein
MSLKRNGLRTLRDAAYHICRWVAFWTPAIQLAYPANPALMGALAAANQACALLVDEADQVLSNE